MIPDDVYDIELLLLKGLSPAGAAQIERTLVMIVEMLDQMPEGQWDLMSEDDRRLTLHPFSKSPLPNLQQGTSATSAAGRQRRNPMKPESPRLLLTLRIPELRGSDSPSAGATPPLRRLRRHGHKA
jgi:hypothetical protein